MRLPAEQTFSTKFSRLKIYCRQHSRIQLQSATQPDGSPPRIRPGLGQRICDVRDNHKYTSTCRSEELPAVAAGLVVAEVVVRFKPSPPPKKKALDLHTTKYS